jgi:hypothetical protein
MQVLPNLALAGGGPLLILFRPETQAALGAAAGAWLFISRLILRPIVNRLIERGALALEQFDCFVLRLPWNRAYGPALAEEEVIGSAARASYSGKWYPDVSTAPRRIAVLICQRSNVVWSRRQHDLYANIVSSAAFTWLLAGIVIASATAITLDAYLITVGLPSLPALLDALEIRIANTDTARKRRQLEHALDAALAEPSAGNSDDESMLRSMQDQILEFRRTSPLIPQLLYRWLRKRYNLETQAAAIARLEGN